MCVPLFLNLKLPGFQIQRTDFPYLPHYFILKQQYFILIHLGNILHPFRRKNLLHNPTQLLTPKILIISLTDVLNELHGLQRISVCLNPKPKLLMFTSYPLQDIDE